MYAGIETMVSPVHIDSKLDIIHENKTSLTIIGCVFFASGLILFIGKICKMKKAQGHGLFAVYNCFLFSFIVNWIGLGFDYAWGNLIASFIVGALYLRWKFHIYYYDPLDNPQHLVLD